MEDESNKEVPLYIECSRFGGKRNALSCAHFDRYRGCRRRCKSLEGAMKANEEFVDKVKHVYEARESFMSSKHSLKGLPLEPLRCQICDYVGKSVKGLSIHMKRSHKAQAL